MTNTVLVPLLTTAALIVLAWLAVCLVGFHVGRMFDRRSHARRGSRLVRRS